MVTAPQFSKMASIAEFTSQLCSGLSGVCWKQIIHFCVCHGDHKWMEVLDNGEESGVDAAPDSDWTRNFPVLSACSLSHTLIHSNYISYIF